MGVTIEDGNPAIITRVVTLTDEAAPEVPTL